ncbi:YbgC/FadM family acyl-CoA thioesterase [Flavobacteriaceae bacterium Ap0902]|nr:YbgC/FadM family acyl-CoA thioesterase [Flavobacteriaceae bacterium Ap0902]
MIESTTLLRVRYGETDQMGYVYYGNYAQYFEVARTELLRSIGLTYKELESQGVMLPVLKLESNYIAPARYDDELKINTKIVEIPTGARIQFDYEIYNQDDQLIHKGMTVLVFVDIQKNRPCAAPKYLIEKLAGYDNVE